MKLLHISAVGFPLFKGELSLPFFAQQRVSEEDRQSLFPLLPGSRFYLNCANAFIGVNASGKTSVLKVILLSLELLSSKPINHCETKDILGSAEDAALTIHFLSDTDELCRLETHIRSTGRGSEQKYTITKETLWAKPLSTANTKKKLTDFSGLKPIAVRTDKEIFLPDDTSIIIAYNKKNGQQIFSKSLLSMTDVNILPASEEIPTEVIRYLDPTVEQLTFDHEGQKVTIRLKFEGKKEILLADPMELNRYLSSGTIKGIVTFTYAIKTLQRGGYLIVDELENHFNKEIAATLLRFFMDSSLNKNGGVLIFSTHYPEILDEFDRNDCIFITRNRGSITADNLTGLLQRNDLKKSDVYQSGFLEGTVPAYEAYSKLRKGVQSALKREG